MNPMPIQHQRLTFAIALAAGSLIASASDAAEIHVPSQQATIQAGIDAAVNGDEVVLADGTYTGPGNVNCSFSGKLITVRSASDNPQACIIDCEDVSGTRGFTFDTGETNAALLRGITITRGTASGGAISIISSSPKIENCRFIENKGGSAARAIHGSNSSAVITDCHFEGNTTTVPGQSPSLPIVFFVHSQAVLDRCTFYANRGIPLQCAGVVGADALCTILNCRFIDNESFPKGGGVRGINCHAIVVNCLFAGNTSQSGGAIASASGSFHDLHVINCTIFGNTATSDDDLTGGGGIFAEADLNVVVRNSIIRNNLPQNIDVHQTQQPIVDVQFCNMNGAVQATLIDADPLFFDPNGPDLTPYTLDDDYSLRSPSLSIDSGDNTAVPAEILFDLAGNPRFADDPNSPDIGFGTPPLVDMGCYEFQPPAPTTGACCIAGVAIAITEAQCIAVGGEFHGVGIPPKSVECDAVCVSDIAPAGGDGVVNVSDLLKIINDWGACP